MILKPCISEFSVFMALLFFTLWGIILCLLSRKIGWKTLSIIGIGVSLTVLRCFIAIEFPGVKNIGIQGWTSKLYIWLKEPFWKSISWTSILLFGWIWGSIVRLCRLGWVLWRQYKLAQVTKLSPEDHFYQIYLDVLQEMSCTKIGMLSLSSYYPTIMMAGFTRPNILLPENVSQFSDEQLKYIFQHELKHFMYLDLWIKCLFEILCCMLWWNPVAYWLKSCVAQLLEMRCDSRVCKGYTSAQKQDYAETLIQALCVQKENSIFVTASYLGYSSSECIKQRFHQILYANPPRRNVLTCLMIAFSLLIFLSSYCIMILPRGYPDETKDGTMKISSNYESDFILRYPDGTLEIVINNQTHGTISKNEMDKEPYSNMAVIEITEGYWEDIP